MKLEKEVTRRGFFDRAVMVGVVGMTAAGLCVCSLSGCPKKDRTSSVPAKWIEIKTDRIVVNIEKSNILNKVGSSAKVVHPALSDRIMLIHASAARFVALTGSCTHRGRALEYLHSKRELRCINYGHSRFGLDGSLLQGPAKRALKVYRTLYVDGKLEVFL